MTEETGKAWKPPIKCRWFGHKWDLLGYSVEVEIMGISFDQPIEICTKCGCGRFHTILRGWSGYAPNAVQNFLARRKLEDTGNLVEADFSLKRIMRRGEDEDSVS